MSDEHRPDVVGYEGHPVVRTPTLDRLAQTGVAFRNAYCPSPVCIPSRQCMMAGQLPKTCGCEGWIDLKPGHMTFARRLMEWGYHTTAIGKLHHFGPDASQGWLERPAGDVAFNASTISDNLQRAEVEKYTMGRFKNVKWSNAKEIARAGVERTFWARLDEMWTDAAVQYIQDYFASQGYDRPMSQPLLLKVSMLRPHYPFFAEEEKFTYYLNRVQPFEEQVTPAHPFFEKERGRVVTPGEDASVRDIRRAWAAYCAMIESIDDGYARVLSALEQVGQNLDDWIIIYTSDHGDMMGEHNLWEKTFFYEASSLVPLIIRWPKRFGGGRVVTENVNLCDLFATLCDATGVPTPGGLDSRSMLPLMAGNASGWDNESVSQYNTDRLMIKRDDLKYVWWGKDMPEQLFDLAADPTERRDFARDSGHSDAMRAFRARRVELGHPG